MTEANNKKEVLTVNEAMDELLVVFNKIYDGIQSNGSFNPEAGRKTIEGLCKMATIKLCLDKGIFITPEDGKFCKNLIEVLGDE